MTAIRLAVAQQATETLGNASSGVAIRDGFGDSSGLVPTIAIVIVIIVFAVGMMSSARFYRWVLGASGRFATSVEYAIKGVATAAVIAVFAAPVYLLATMDAGTRSLLFRGAAVAVVGYLGLVALGYVGEYAWGRIVAQHEAATGRHPLERLRSDETEAGDS